MAYSTVVLRNAKFVETSFPDGSKQLTGLVRGDSFVNLSIPTSPNPRQFTGDANPNYRAMVATLRTEPEMFGRKNSAGITIFATSCDANGDGSYTLTFANTEGIANGGHTYHALKAHGRDNSYVKVTVEIGLDPSRVKDVAQALNMNKKLQLYSLQNKSGLFDWHKEALQEQSFEISYHEGDTGIIDIKESISFLHLFFYDLETKTLPILENLYISEKNTNRMLRTISSGFRDLSSSLQFIAKDVHELSKYIILNQNYLDQLKILKVASGQNWIKTRSFGTEKHKGILKSLALLLVAGLAKEGTILNHNDVVRWKPSFQTFEQRKKFLDELFNRVFDIVSVEEGTPSDIIRREYIAKNILKHASIICTKLNPPTRKRKMVS